MFRIQQILFGGGLDTLVLFCCKLVVPVALEENCLKYGLFTLIVPSFAAFRMNFSLAIKPPVKFHGTANTSPILRESSLLPPVFRRSLFNSQKSNSKSLILERPYVWNEESPINYQWGDLMVFLRLIVSRRHQEIVLSKYSTSLNKILI